MYSTCHTFNVLHWKVQYAEYEGAALCTIYIIYYISAINARIFFHSRFSRGCCLFRQQFPFHSTWKIDWFHDRNQYLSKITMSAVVLYSNKTKPAANEAITEIPQFNFSPRETIFWNKFGSILENWKRSQFGIWEIIYLL